MKTTLKGKQFIAQREGCVTIGYLDGKLKDGSPRYSQGFGMLSTKDAAPITLEQAWTMLGEKLVAYEDDVNRALGDTPITRQMWDALASLYWNDGAGRKKELIATIKAGDLTTAADMFLTFDHGGSAGHIRRRGQERDVFLHGRYGDLEEVLVWFGDPKTTKAVPHPMPKG